MGPIPALSDRIEVLDRASVSVARERVRQAAALVSMADVDAERLATAVSELAQNQLDYAVGGWIVVDTVQRGGLAGIEVVAGDLGPGIADPWGALSGGGHAHGLGSGLPAVRRLCHEVDVDIRQGEGTLVRVRRFTETPAWHPEVAILGRAVAGEPSNGDHAVLVRDGEGLLVAVIDGVGHGPEARHAAGIAGRSVERDPGAPLAAMLARAHEDLHGSRGVAMTLARWSAGTLELLGVGNVATLVVGQADEQRFQPTAGIVGARMGHVREPKLLPFVEGDTLVLATDGLSSRAHPERRNLAKGSMAVAQQLLQDHGKDHDDALIAVIR